MNEIDSSFNTKSADTSTICPESQIIVNKAISLLLRARSWLKFLGYIYIIASILYFIKHSASSSTIAENILSSGIQLTSGIILLHACKCISIAERRRDISDIESSFKSIGRFFMLNGILLLVFCGIIMIELIALLTIVLL